MTIWPGRHQRRMGLAVAVVVPGLSCTRTALENLASGFFTLSVAPQAVVLAAAPDLRQCGQAHHSAIRVTQGMIVGDGHITVSVVGQVTGVSLTTCDYDDQGIESSNHPGTFYERRLYLADGVSHRIDLIFRPSSMAVPGTYPIVITANENDQTETDTLLLTITAPPPPPPPPPPPVCMGIEPVADAYIQGGANGDTPYGTGNLLIVKGSPNLPFARKTYLVFDITTTPQAFTSAVLRLTVNSHTATNPRLFGLYGVIDNGDWDLTALGESSITWNNAPKNDPGSGIAFTGQGATAGDAVRLLQQTTLDNTDPPGTTYDFDVSGYLHWAWGDDPAFSSLAPGGDTDGRITLLLAHGLEVLADDGSLFYAREEAQACYRPQLIVN